jgi:hypothetical protein
MVVGSIFILAGPAGAVSTCDESMNPAAGGNASGLIVACNFSNAGVSTALTIQDYADAEWHFGAARTVAVAVTRTGAAPGTVTGSVIKTCATNNTTAAATCFGVAAAQPAGALQIGSGPQLDTNHSIENPLSSATLTHLAIAAGSFIKSVAGTAGTATSAVTLSRPLVATGWPNCPGTYASGCTSAPLKVIISNDSGRQVTDGVTTAGSATVTSATAHFCGGASTCTSPTDVGKGFTGGDIPDGATIATVNSLTSVTLACTGCVGGFTGVSTCPTTGICGNIVLGISPNPAPTSSRYVTDGTSTGTRVLSSASAEFSPSDTGLPIVFVPPIATLAGARVGTVDPAGANTTIAGAGTAVIPSGAKKFVIGQATKTAPATGDAIGSLSILLQVNPSVSPTSPPCAANKISGFQIPLIWRNPQGTVSLLTNTGTGGYNTFVGGTHLSGTQPAPTSIAQFDFRTASTSFSGYLRQDYTTVGSVQGASTYRVAYTFLPVTVGLCPGTGDAATWSFFGLTTKIAANPSFTGGGGGGARGIVSEPQNTSQVYSGGPPASATSGAYVTSTAGEQPSNNNSCTVSSPALIQIGC